MEVKQYNHFVVIKPMGSSRERSSKPNAKPLPRAKIKPKPKTELEAKGLTLDNKEKLDTVYAKILLRLVGNSLIIFDLVLV